MEPFIKKARYILFKNRIFLIYMSSLYIGFLTPGELGEFVKVLYLTNDKKISIGAGFSSVLTDRL